MSDQDGPFELQGIKHTKNIIRQTLRGVPSFGFTGGAKAAPGNTENVVIRSEFRGKLIVNMGRFPTPCQQNDGAASTSPIYNFETDIGLDLDKLNLWRWIGIWLLAAQCCGCQRQNRGCKFMLNIHRAPSLRYNAPARRSLQRRRRFPLTDRHYFFPSQFCFFHPRPVV